MLLGLCVVLPAAAQDAEEESKKIDLTMTFPNAPEVWIRPSLRWDTAWFTGTDAWGGDTTANIGHRSHGWAEVGLVPALDGELDLGDAGTIHGRVSGVYTTTQLGLDWGGSNYKDGKVKHPQEFTLEDAYLRWRSGDALPSLGKDALEISVGAQDYRVGPGTVGDGFLFYNGGSDGGDRGGYWLGLRNAFEFATVTRLTLDEFEGEVVYLRSDDGGNDHTNLTGANFAYDFGKLLGIERLKFGAGYWRAFESDSDRRRDGLNIVDVRLDTAPIPDLPGLGFTTEFVKEDNGDRNDSFAAWGELGYDFAANDVPCKPYLSYRYAYFSGNDKSTKKDEAFDPLYYGFSDWEYWYIGEIAGEWVTGNSNFNANIVKARANPFDPLTLSLYYIYLRLNEKQTEQAAPGGRPIDPRVLSINDKDLAHEVDLIADVTVNDYLSLSFVAAVLVPLQGGKQFFGNDNTWTQFMAYTTFSF